MKAAAALVTICIVFGAIGVFGYVHINNLEDSLDETREKVSKLNENIDTKEAKVDNLKRKISTQNQEIVTLENQIDNLENKLLYTKTELQNLKQGNRYELHDPTYSEVRQFIKEDKTDENEYVKDEYVCVDYAADVNKNAMEEGIQCAFVDIRFSTDAHAIVAFQTVDRGLVFVEPQEDIIIPELREGQEYYDVLDKNTPKRIREEAGDTIQRLIVIW